MERKDLMRAIMLATGISFTAHAVTARPNFQLPAAVEHAQPQGFIKSGNPNAVGGPKNPGVGNPFNIY